jgi:hypothetical protein
VEFDPGQCNVVRSAGAGDDGDSALDEDLADAEADPADAARHERDRSTEVEVHAC